MSISMKAAHAAVRNIDGLVQQIRGTKRAKEESDPGSVGGETTHPTKSTENSTIDSTEGSRSKENDGDLEHDQPVGVNQAAEGMPGGQDAVQLNIGTKQSPPGEDPAAETERVGDKLPDPGSIGGKTTHPANLDNSAIAHKYGSARKLNEKLASIREKGHQVLAKIAVSNTGGQSQPAKKAGDEVLPPETVTGKDDEKPSTASVTGGKTDTPSDDKKEAAMAAGAQTAKVAMLAKQERDTLVLGEILQTQKKAAFDATVTADYYDRFFVEAEGKSAGDDESERDDSSSDSSGGEPSKGDDDSAHKHESGGKPEHGGSSHGGDAGGPPASGHDGGSGGDMNDDQLMQLLSGGQQMGGPSAMGDMLNGPTPGGEDMLGGGGGAGAGAPGAGAAPPAGGMPGAGGGMPGAGGMGAAGGAGGVQDLVQVLHQLPPQVLSEILAQLGTSPEMAQAKAAEKMARARRQGFKSLTGYAPKSDKEAAEFERMRRVVAEIVS
jgi:hypothetical protein